MFAPMNLSSLFSPKRRSSSSSSSSRGGSKKSPNPRLDRSYAARFADYDPDSPADPARASAATDTAYDLAPPRSLRIDGAGEFDVGKLCDSLGLSGPEEFAVDIDAWKGRKAPRSPPPTSSLFDEATPPLLDEAPGGGIKGARPTMLAPPPFRSGTFQEDSSKTTWDLVRSLAPEVEVEVEEDADVAASLLVHGGRGTDATASWSFTTVNDDDCSSTTTEGFSISPNGRRRWQIGSWDKIKELGRGSFGTVYEAISEDGVFFAVKEVSLLDEIGDGRQSIEQLEQEIVLLSQFEHENIVRYIGTEKKEDKFYIFLELATQGSLRSLYNKYRLQDSQVSAYTWQILHGLQYLHDRSVVHRDIKCANILVDASGSAKLADFGLAKQTSRFDLLKSCKGSIYWMAPEVIMPGRCYGTSADIWSLGCTVLEMLTRKPPYMSEQQPSFEQDWVRTFYLIGKGVKPDIPDSLSANACDFINQCIQVNPDDRPSAAELLNHPFVKRQSSTLNSPRSHFYGRP